MLRIAKIASCSSFRPEVVQLRKPVAGDGISSQYICRYRSSFFSCVPFDRAFLEIAPDFQSPERSICRGGRFCGSEPHSANE